MTRRQRILHRLTWLLVATIGAIAFTASFEAIADYAGQVGWGAQMKYAAPLLVDTFTVAAGLVILARAEAGVRAVYAWSLLITAAGVSIGLNIAHAPPHLAARVVAALPPAALLAAVELAMSEARRSRKGEPAGTAREHAPAKPAPVTRVAGVGEDPPEGSPTSPPARSALPKPAAKSTPGADRSAERARVVRAHLAEHPDASANAIKKVLRDRQIGVGESGAFYQLVNRVKAEANGKTPEREQVPS